MGCGKSKHDVVTGNTTKIRKPLEADQSVKGKESETIKRQESCRCRKNNDISDVVSGEAGVENITKNPEEKQDEGGYEEKTAVEMTTNDDKTPEDKETTTTLSPVEAVAAIVPENITTEENVNDVNESVSPVVDELQKEDNDIETVVEEEKSIEDNIDGGVDTQVPSTEVEEPKPDVEIPVTTEVEARDISTTENEEIEATETETAVAENETVTAENDETVEIENEEIIAVENDETTVAENETVTAENDETVEIENEEIATAENSETAAAENDGTAAAEDVVEETPADLTKEVESV
ncbi:KNR4/SMI1 homolog isoform X2 [Capsella rubella]|uniref:KNR4/SMI1 homolog isoform X2 n=1 Tax=Capsella rubella TaxID=81985 RepID=UPI000CD4BA98|nr:KNR4/SMI1 homolog isoform X2 [Capsella rubella]